MIYTTKKPPRVRYYFSDANKLEKKNEFVIENWSNLNPAITCFRAVKWNGGLANQRIMMGKKNKILKKPQGVYTKTMQEVAS